MNEKSLIDEKVLPELFDDFIQLLNGFAEIFEAASKIKRIEEETGETILKKGTVEEIIEKLSQEETIEVLSKDPKIAQDILKLFGKMIKAVSLTSKIDIEKAKAEELAEVARDMKEIINIMKLLREKLWGIR